MFCGWARCRLWLRFDGGFIFSYDGEDIKHQVERASVNELSLFHFDVGSSMFMEGFQTSTLRVGRSGEEGVSRRFVGSPAWVVGISALDVNPIGLPLFIDLSISDIPTNHLVFPV